GYRLQPLAAQLKGRVSNRAFVERRVLVAIELVAAGQLETDATDAALQVVRPAAHRRQRFARGTRQAQYAYTQESLALDQRIHEVRGADHHAFDIRGLDGGGVQHGASRAHDAAAHVAGRRP